MAVQYYKSVPSNLKSHDLQYELNTLIVDPKQFDPVMDWGNGIHFTTFEYVL